MKPAKPVPEVKLPELVWWPKDSGGKRGSILVTEKQAEWLDKVTDKNGSPSGK